MAKKKPKKKSRIRKAAGVAAKIGSKTIWPLTIITELMNAKEAGAGSDIVSKDPFRKKRGGKIMYGYKAGGKV
jgi:hypothetical protein